jgi:Helix-turn-helix of DDE superfamily endonuclease
LAQPFAIDIIADKQIDQKVVELSSSKHYFLVGDSTDHAVFLLKAYKMTFSYHQIKERPKLLLAMTGLTHTEFAQLLPHFQSAWDQYLQQNYIDRDDRQRQYGGGQPEATLVNIEEKLLFILYYVKVYPLQEILAFEFDMVQSTANEWIHILSGVLQKALDHGGYLPERDAKQLGTVLESEDESTYGIDGTERPRQRPCHPEKQKHYYSGKKKRTPSRISLLVASIRAKSIT